ncbi:PIN domain-containing protein [Candidatus Woesearchaeota archaeon]|nr:PIN domain-containing protein [Candidatus Woesearchaeota archaeon]
MILIIDTNILISALIRDSTTRKIIIESGWEFYYPENSFHEIRKYKNLVLEKSGMTKQEYTKLLNNLLKYITLIPEELVQPKLKEANDLLGKIDPDDAIFLASALSLGNSKIWSDDPHLEKQSRVRTLKTKHIVKLFFPEEK